MAKKFLLLFWLCVFLLSACTPAVETAASPTFTRDAKATPTPTLTPVPVSKLGVDAESLRGVTLMAWHPWFGIEASFFETQVANFNAQNQWDITVLTAGQSNYAELFNNVTDALAAPDKPDVVIGLPEHAAFWDERSGVLDLAPYVGDPVWGLGADEVSDFPPVIWEQDQIGDKRLGMPAQRTTRLMLYNQTWAAELGFSAPPTTAEEFREQACKANAAFRLNQDPMDDALGGWLVDTDAMTAYAWMLAFGGGPLEGNDYHFLRPENIDAFRFAKTLYEEGCAFQLKETTPIEVFATRRALFVTGSLEDLPAQSRAFLDHSNSDEWRLIPFPGKGAETLAVYGSSFIVLPTTGERQLAAWLFIRWMLEPENQVRWVETTGMFPLRSSTLNLLASYAAVHPQWVEAVKLLPHGQGTPRFGSWRLARFALGDGFDFMFRVNLPVGQVPAVLADMDRTVQDLTR